jgi:DNA-binding YbaB/EbfC family protein
MFDKIRQMMSLLGNLPKMREQVEGLQSRIAQITADGDAGAGMVKVRVNGRMEVLSLNLSDEALKGGDREMLEDLIKSAVNQAITKARQAVAEETGKMAQGMGLPPGMQLPGLG